jgi:hypothetical protein
LSRARRIARALRKFPDFVAGAVWKQAWDKQIVTLF